jgi:hypothetical protein
MRKIIFAASDYLDKKKTEKASEVKAWREIHEAKVKADERGTAGAALAGEGWGEYEEACQIKDDEAKFDAVADAAIAKITEGNGELNYHVKMMARSKIELSF